MSGFAAVATEPRRREWEGDGDGREEPVMERVNERLGGVSARGSCEARLRRMLQLFFLINCVLVVRAEARGMCFVPRGCKQVCTLPMTRVSVPIRLGHVACPLRPRYSSVTHDYVSNESSEIEPSYSLC